MKPKINPVYFLFFLPFFVFNSCSSNSDPEEPLTSFLMKYDGTVWKTSNGIYLSHGLETEYYLKIKDGNSTVYKEIWAWDGNGCYNEVQVPDDLNYEMDIVQNKGDFLHVKLSEKVNTPDGLPFNVWNYTYEVVNDELILHVEAINNYSGDSYEFDEVYERISVDTRTLQPICEK